MPLFPQPVIPNNMDTRHRKILLDHIPEPSLDLIVSWLEQYRVSLTITRKRNTKMGDYRPPVRKNYHRISVNGDLHPIAFLVTLVHELAHLVTWEKYQRKVQPHGPQWKNQFRQMLLQVSGTGAFIPEIEKIISGFIMENISYRSFNLHFERRIHELDPDKKDLILGEIPVNSEFSIHNGRIFIKKEKLRTRYRCQDVRTGKFYLISPLARVQLRSDAG